MNSPLPGIGFSAVTYWFVATQLALGQTAPTDTFCIHNASATNLFFTTETREGFRTSATLRNGGILCSAPTREKDGIVSAYQSEHALEGCSRIIPTQSVEKMIAFAEFDRCVWSSHQDQNGSN